MSNHCKIRQFHRDIFAKSIKVDLINTASRCLKQNYIFLLTSDVLNFRIGRSAESDHSFENLN